jgi:uncharacterized protein
MTISRERVIPTQKLPQLWSVSRSLNDIELKTPHPEKSRNNEHNVSRISAATATMLYAAVICVAEVISNFYSVIGGVTLHAAVFAVLIVHGALASKRSASALWLSLSLIPLIRIVSFGMPLGSFPQEWWYLLTGIPLLAASFTAIQGLGYSRFDVGLRFPAGGRAIMLSLAVGVSGVFIGLGEYAILGPTSTFAGRGNFEIAVAIFIILIGTGFTEEVVFRGVLQTSATRALRPVAGILLVSALFAVMHIGHGSIANLFYTFAISVYFCVVRHQTGSLLGVTIAHTLANVVFFIVMSEYPNG